MNPVQAENGPPPTSRMIVQTEAMSFTIGTVVELILMVLSLVVTVLTTRSASKVSKQHYVQAAQHTKQPNPATRSNMTNKPRKVPSPETATLRQVRNLVRQQFGERFARLTDAQQGAILVRVQKQLLPWDEWIQEELQKATNSNNAANPSNTDTSTNDKE